MKNPIAAIDLLKRHSFLIWESIYKTYYICNLGSKDFVADPIVTATRGKGIGEHIGDGVHAAVVGAKATVEFHKSMWDNLVSGLTDLENSFRSWRPSY